METGKQIVNTIESIKQSRTNQILSGFGDLEKAHIKSYTRTSKSGKQSQVKEHEDKRIKKTSNSVKFHNIQVVDADKSVKDLKKIGFDVIKNKKYDDEIKIKIDDSNKDKARKWLNKNGFSKEDIQDVYPDLYKQLY